MVIWFFFPIFLNLLLVSDNKRLARRHCSENVFLRDFSCTSLCLKPMRRHCWSVRFLYSLIVTVTMSSCDFISSSACNVWFPPRTSTTHFPFWRKSISFSSENTTPTIGVYCVKTFALKNEETSSSTCLLFTCLTIRSGFAGLKFPILTSTFSPESIKN